MTTARRGTQSIERAIGLMRALAARARFGWRLSDIARHCDMDKGTARRILACLVRERLAEHSAADQRYLPGPLLFELGLALPDHDAFKAAARPLLDDLALQTRAVSFLCMRSGDDLVCAARVGDVPDQAFTLNVGTRRPLMTSAAGVAMLIALPEDERRRAYLRNREAAARDDRIPQNSLERMFRRSLEAGMGVNEENLVPGWSSYAVAVRNPAGQPFAAVMISAPTASFTASRVATVKRLLQRAAKDLQATGQSIFCR